MSKLAEKWAALKARWRLELVEDWRNARHWLSVKVAAIGALVSGGLALLDYYWPLLPPDLRAVLPPWVSPTVTAVLFAATILARVKKQAPAPAKETSP